MSKGKGKKINRQQIGHQAPTDTDKLPLSFGTVNDNQYVEARLKRFEKSNLKR